jgi:tRNA pseudouridine32 synthase / 23S rRNA pseudouridine746 synthase
MNGLGIPIINDRIYPQLLPQAADGAEDYRQPLQLLAQSLEFVDPVDGRLRQFESRLSLEF